MIKEQVWVCDICGQEAKSDGYPSHWLQIEIRRGSYFHTDDPPMLDVDCCGMLCVLASLKAFESFHQVSGVES